MLYVLAAVIFAGLISTPESTIVDDALRGLAVGASLVLPVVLLYVSARSPQGHHRRHQHGRARFLTLGMFVLVALGGFSLLRCRANLPPVANCTPYSHRCNDGYTELCSASQRWHRDGDVPCARIGQVCLEGACVDPPADAGADGGAP